MARVNAELANLGRDLQRRNRELARALEEIRVLRGMLPVCMHCKRIRDDQGFWQGVESYLREHAGAQVTHGLCEECLEKHFG